MGKAFNRGDPWADFNVLDGSDTENKTYNLFLALFDCLYGVRMLFTDTAHRRYFEHPLLERILLAEPAELALELLMMCKPIATHLPNQLCRGSDDSTGSFSLTCNRQISGYGSG